MTRSASAVVDFPDPDNPVNQRTKPVLGDFLHIVLGYKQIILSMEEFHDLRSDKFVWSVVLFLEHCTKFCTRDKYSF